MCLTRWSLGLNVKKRFIECNFWSVFSILVTEYCIMHTHKYYPNRKHTKLTKINWNHQTLEAGIWHMGTPAPIPFKDIC